VRCARPAHSPLHCNQNQEDSRRHQSCRGEGGTTAGEFLKPIMWPIIRSTPDSRPGQPQTKKRKCGIQPAHQSLFTDVFGSRLLLCTIHQCKNFTMSPRGDGKPCAVCLTGDIRVGCPDRRIDRLCITCCSPSQPSHHAGCPARSRLRRERGGLLVTLTLGHHGPGHPGNLVGKRDGRSWSGIKGLGANSGRSISALVRRTSK
jgi:hypothetical protein